MRLYLQKVVMDVLSLPVLVLNRNFVPVRVASVRRALVLLFSGLAKVLDEAGEFYDFGLWRSLPVRNDDEGVALVVGAIRAPRVLCLSRYERVPKQTLKLSRENLMLRDNHECQYCGRKGLASELNLDHVMPKSRGGAYSWENLVTSCKPCNLRKGRRTPSEANMTLRSKPIRPRWTFAKQLAQGVLATNKSQLAGTKKSVHIARYKEWEPYLQAG
jgi:5-methylcytosine-specific restriction endonuclease McrA